VGAAGEDWDDVLESWSSGSPHARLRAYSDAVAERLLRRWLDGVHARVALKTDAFDEAVGVGLVPVLQRHADSVVVIDAADRLVAAAAARYPTATVERGDVRELSYPDEAFGLVVSTSTLDHFADVAELDRALGELTRVLAPGGTLVVTLDNPLHPLVAARNRMPGLLRRLGVIPYGTGATCGPRHLEALVRTRGLVVRAQSATMHVPRVLALAWLLVRGDGASELLRFERLAAAPTRYLTGQFVAVLARKP
jgi:SAM-dependent methyltransferase